MLDLKKTTVKQNQLILNGVNKILTNPNGSSVPCLEAEIDHLVYDLYGLTEDEIKIVEGVEK